MAEKKTGSKMGQNLTKGGGANVSSTETQIAETAAKGAVKKRNRPDLQDFGNEGMLPGDNARFLKFELNIAQLPKIDLNNPVAVEERIMLYFNMCIEADMKPAVAGLAMALGTNRKSLWEWREGKSRVGAMTDLIKNAYALLELHWEDMMQNGKINPVSGIFLGKNHFGYQDKQDVVITPNNPFEGQRSESDLIEEYGTELPPANEEN